MASHLRRLWAVAYNTYLESVRQRLFIGLLLFAFLLLTTSLILKDVSVRQDFKILQDIGLAATEFFGTLIAIFLGADLIGRDIERRTLHLLVVKPLTRAEFLVGRYLGLCLTLLTSVVLMASGLALALLTAQGRFTWSEPRARIIPVGHDWETSLGACTSSSPSAHSARGSVSALDDDCSKKGQKV